LIVEATDFQIENGAALIDAGGLVAFPTETVYGLGADALNPLALARVFELKNRPRFDPLIIHIAGMSTLFRLVDYEKLGPDAKNRLTLLIEKFWPGPLTIILPKNEIIPDLATSGLKSAAFRFPSNRIARKLISLTKNGAVAAPSANPFGFLSPTRAEHVEAAFSTSAMTGGKPLVVLDGGPCDVGLESTVLDITGGKPRLLRPGGLPAEEIASALGEELVSGGEGAESNAASPGQSKSHYAPNTPLYLHESAEFSKLKRIQGCAYLPLAPSLRGTASLLFESLHKLDSGNYSAIHAELPPLQGLGLAINDRLTRAAARGTRG
jgi:L-threonylcarbamoyladenylate synthase